jgi:D-alanyl-D-alanine carboxypeptidase
VKSLANFLLIGLAALSLALTGASRAHAEAKLLIDAATGKVLRAENATSPWYPASVTKLMTTYTTLRAIKAGRIGFNSLITVTPNAAAQQPTKMGFKVGTKLTIDNALKMMLVKSANDVAVAIAEGVGGSIAGFADMMNANAKRLGMSESHFVNPNGLPAEGHVTSARDLAILARALITEFPEDDFYWHIHSIRYGNRIIHNYNTLLDRYPGADGMKTGFICASGYNVVASATRNGRRLIAVVLGAYSGGARMQEAAQLLESGFNSGVLSWLTPSLGTVDELAPIDAQPPNLREQMCGAHRHKPPSEDNNEDEGATADGDNSSAQAFMLSSLKASAGKFVLGPPIDSVPPVVVFTGSADHPDKAPQTVAAKAKRHHHVKKKTAAKTTNKTTKKKEAAAAAKKKTAAKPAHRAKAAKRAKPKVSTAAK